MSRGGIEKKKPIKKMIQRKKKEIKRMRTKFENNLKKSNDQG
jgi:hypothetical protein